MRILLWALVLIAVMPLAALPAAPGSPVSLPAGSARVDDLKGEVTLRSPQGEAIPSQRGQVLPVDSTVETGKGTVLLSLQDDSEVLVKAHSKIVLRAPDRDQGFFLELFLGRLLAKVQKRLGNAPSFKMGTPTAVITVRGTRFQVEVNRRQHTTVEVYEGLVEVLGMGAGAVSPVLLRPGFQTEIERNRIPEEPHRMLEGAGGPIERDLGPGGRDSLDRERRDGALESPGAVGPAGTGEAGSDNGSRTTPPRTEQHAGERD